MKRILILSTTLVLWLIKPGLAADVGVAAPNCSLQGFNGQTIDLQGYKGKVVYLDFWASWCGPCAKSFPFLEKLQQEFSDDALQIIGVNMDEQEQDAKNFLDQYPVTFLQSRDENEQCAQSFAVQAMPSSYLIGRDGVIRLIHMGFRADESDSLRQTVKALLAEASVAR